MTHPIKWHGGKTYLAKWIQSLAPEHTHRVHVFGGGLGEFWTWPHEGVSEVVNDVHHDLMTFWQVLQGDGLFDEFKRSVEAIPFSQKEFDYADVLLGRHACTDMVMRAVAFFIRVRQSRQGLMRDFATLSRNRTSRGMNEQVSAWLTAIEGLPEVHERLKRVVILNQDWRDVLSSQDGPNTLFYLDPPYLHETRTATDAYAHEMSFEDHDKLLRVLTTIEGNFMLSGYHSILYDKHAAFHGWHCHEKEIDNKASGAKTKEKKIECLWTNYEATA